MRFQYTIRRNDPVTEQRDRELEDYLASLQPTPWTAVTFQNSWANYGGGYRGVGYRKVGDMVQVGGLMKDGTVGAAAFTLPVGFRPPAALIFRQECNLYVGCRVDVNSDGSVVVVGYDTGGTNNYVSLSGISFSISP